MSRNHTRFGTSRPGLLVSRDTGAVTGYEPRPCPECGVRTIHPLCCDCANQTNPYRNLRFSMEVGSEDSTDQRRVADGTSTINAGLPGVDTVVGMRPDGKPILEYRPITNNELATARARREYAKRNGCEPVQEKIKRAIGG